MKCKHYRYKWEVVGYVGVCSLELFGGLHVITCNGKGNCPHYEEKKKEGKHKCHTIQKTKAMRT